VPRTKFWTRGIFNTDTASDFHQVQLTTNSLGDTLLRVHFQLYMESVQVIPASGWPLRPAMLFVGFYDGPWATWAAAHPTVPAESTYGWLHYERAQWGMEEHSIDTTKFDVWRAPVHDIDRDIKAQRVVKANGDGLVAMGWLAPDAGSINPFGMHIYGAYEALWMSP